MKNRIGFILLSLLLWSLSGESDNKVFAFSPFSPNLVSRNYDYLQADQNSQAAIFSEIVFSKNIASEENILPFPGFGLLQFSTSENKLSNVKKALTFPGQDRRKLILQQIYPFHFFW